MREVLIEHNRRLRHSLQELRAFVEAAEIPAELEPYRALILDMCAGESAAVERNLRDLALMREEILEDVRSNTQDVITRCMALSIHFAVPILRASQADRLPLWIIGWMHAAHGETAPLAPAFADGATAVWPGMGRWPIYFLPCMDRRGLLYLALLFHELGHLLYARHEPEMDDLVKDLQRKIDRHLRPASQRNDRHAEEQARQRQVIVEGWYAWAQEFFCDAVGLIVGGPAFLYAFAAYVSRMDPDDFAPEEEEIRGSSHPVTWLRVQLLVERARTLGYEYAASYVERQWLAVAEGLAVCEDYHGCYDDTVGEALRATLEDMLVEVDPRACLPEEAAGGGECRDELTPVQILTWAWQTYIADPEHYLEWERKVLAEIFE